MDYIAIHLYPFTLLSPADGWARPFRSVYWVRQTFVRYSESGAYSNLEIVIVSLEKGSKPFIDGYIVIS